MIGSGWKEGYCAADSDRVLVGVTGDRLQTVGCYRVPFRIGEHSFHPKCFVCKEQTAFPTECLIGQNILRDQGADLLLSKGVLEINGTRVPIVNWGRPGGSEASSNEIELDCTVKVRLIGTCYLPPRSESIVKARASAPLKVGQLAVVDASTADTVSGVAVAPVLVKIRKDGIVPIRVANTTLQEIKLSRKKVMGTLVDAEIGELPESANADCNALSEIDVAAQFDLAQIDETQRERLLALIKTYRDVFSWSNTDIGHCSAVKHRIPTGDGSPVYRRAYRIPYAKREEMERQVNELLENGIIEHSTSPWGAPALLVQKPDGSYRFVVDFRDLNKITRVDPYPLPNIQETLSQLGNAKYFTVVDMASGYWQIEMDEADKEKTAFNTPSGHYQWKRMPMGLVNSASVWQRTADVVLAGLLGKSCYVYLDDIIIYSDSFEGHLRDIEEIFNRLEAAGLKLKPSKCQFLKPEVKYLGHIVSAEGVRPDPAKVECVQNFPTPTDKTSVRQFLGLLTYYRRHIKNFAETARPLTQLTTKKPFFWGEEAEEAFQCLKQKLIEAPVLKFPDFSKPFYLTTDASKYAIGAILSQVFDGAEHPVAYASRQLNEAEQKYGATEQECLGVVWGVRHFRCYLYGRHFTIITDCQPLKWLINARDPSSRLARWNLLLQEYDFEVVHKAGAKNKNADALSRATIRHVDIFIPSAEETRLRDEQRRDSDLRAIIDKCESSPSKSSGGFLLDRGGALRFLDPRHKSQARLVAPRSMVGEILRSYHDAPHAGHPGVKKMVKRVVRRYFWKGMRGDIIRYCRACESCGLRKVQNARRPAPMQVFQEVRHPFERAAMDVVGPLPVTTSGNKYILVFVDHLTRYAEAFPMPDQRAETVARVFVERVVLRHGVVRQLLTDQGSNFTGRLMNEVYELLGVKKLQTTAYHPECNGAVERLNQTLIRMLSHYVSHDQRDWDLWLPFAVFAYNTAFHEGIKESPFFLLHGREAMVPEAAFETPRVNYGTLDNYREELVQRLSLAHSIAASALTRASHRRKQRHDKNAGDEGYRVGDRVYLRVETVPSGMSRKLAPKWSGPFRVIEKLSEVTFKIHDVSRGEDKVVHANRLKLAHDPFAEAITNDCVTTGSHPHRCSLPLGSPNPNLSSHHTIPMDLLTQALMEEAQGTVTSGTIPSSEDPPAPRYALRSRGPVPGVP